MQARLASVRKASGSGAALLARVERAGASVRLGRDGTLVLRGSSRISAALRAEIEREKESLVVLLLARERWAQATTDRERR